MSTNEFIAFLSYLKNKKILITTHDLVDIDGFASCYVLKFFLNQYYDNQQISILFSNFSKSTKKFMNKISKIFIDHNLLYKKSANFLDFDVCLIVDTNKISQTALDINSRISETKIPVIFIDHHYLEKKNSLNVLNPLNLIFENYSSTAEIILEMFENFNIILPLPIRYLTIAAILTDTGSFKYANNRTIKNVSKLLDNDLNIQDIKLMLEKEVDLSEKVAIIKGLQRVEFFREGNYLIGITKVSSYGSSVASHLINLGFDIGIVHSKEKHESIFTIRANRKICIRTGLNVGKILEEMSKYCDGSGGGHDGAASLTCKMNGNIILYKIIDKIKQILNK